MQKDTTGLILQSKVSSSSPLLPAVFAGRTEGEENVETEEVKGEYWGRVRLVVFGSSKEEEKVLTEKEVAGEVKRREARNNAATIRLWYLAMPLRYKHDL